MPEYNTIIGFFDEYINHYRELLSFENIKLQYIIKDNVKELSECLPKEQALIMKGNSLESKRISLLSSQGLEGEKFSEIAKNAPEQYSHKMQTRFDELSRCVFEIKRINDEAMSAVRSKLSYIEKRTATPSGNLYDVKGDRKNSASTAFAMTKNI